MKKLSPIVFGTSCLGNLYKSIPMETKVAIAAEWFKAFERPVIDSAGKYGAGLSLECIGKALKALGKKNGDLTISVKLGWRRSRRLDPGEEPTFEPGAWAGLEYDAVQDISYDGIMRCHAEAKDLLGGFPIDLVSVHDPDEYLAHAESQRGGECRDKNALRDLSLSAPLRDIKEAYAALFELKARGEAESVGIGSKDWRVIEMLWRDGVKLDWAMFACQPTLLVHPPELISFVDELKAAGVTLIDSAVFNERRRRFGASLGYKATKPRNAWNHEIHERHEKILCRRMRMKTRGMVAVVSVVVSLAAVAQIVERPRPAGWENLVPGGRFMDRFESASVIGNGWTTNCWGGDNVKPRDVRNGIEDAEYSYWGGNITKIGREYHLFVARWKESEPRGHMFWPHSEIAHAVSNRSDGDFKVVEVIGPGHNPELFRCKDGSFAVYCIDSKSQAHVYRSATVNGPWKYERLPLDLNGRKLIEGESNFSFTRRPDGSVLAVCRGGAIWLSEDGIKPFVMMTGRVYPDVAGRFEDPVLWRDEVQYHLVVNDWLGRVAWYLTSPDGFNWTTQPGEAYRPGIARVAGGVTNEWFKYERMRVTTDVYGRVFQANFAVIDCVKREDRGGDMHSSKNITIPVNPGRRVQTFRKTRRGWEMRIMKERGFNPLADVDVETVTFGPQSMVAFGAGVKPVGTDEANGDLVLIFPLIELDTPVVKALGREKSGRLFFATCRTDGTKLAGDCR